MEDSTTTLLDTDSVLEPFLLLARDASGNTSTITAVIPKILSHPEIFCGFDQIKSLLSQGNASPLLLATLDLFSYGTYSEYASNTSNFTPLNDAQILKLRQLTVLTCVQQACTGGSSDGNKGAIDYTTLARALHLNLPDQRVALEQVLIRCIYARALNGRLCQKSQQLIISTVPPCISRDVPLSHLPSLLSSWQELNQRLENSQSILETAHESVESQLQDVADYCKTVQERQAKAQEMAATNMSSNSSRWPEGSVARRSSTNRQSKRSRGGVGGAFTNSGGGSGAGNGSSVVPSETFQRYG